MTGTGHISLHNDGSISVSVSWNFVDQRESAVVPTILAALDWLAERTTKDNYICDTFINDNRASTLAKHLEWHNEYARTHGR